MAEVPGDFSHILETMKRCAAWLGAEQVDFVLAGSVAAWARGGPAICSDLDFVIRPGDSERALEILAAHGLRTERPPEGWLVKAYDGDVLVDLIHEPHGLDLEPAFEEHYIDFEALLPIARALREQIDWSDVRRRTADRPIAVGFLALAEALGVAPGQRGLRAVPEEPRIRVTTT